ALFLFPFRLFLRGTGFLFFFVFFAFVLAALAALGGFDIRAEFQTVPDASFGHDCPPAVRIHRTRIPTPALPGGGQSVLTYRRAEPLARRPGVPWRWADRGGTGPRVISGRTPRTACRSPATACRKGGPRSACRSRSCAPDPGGAGRGTCWCRR